MKNNNLAGILLAALALSSIASVIVCILHGMDVRQLRKLRSQQIAMHNQQAVLKQRLILLANDAIEYSKKNPAIDPVLERLGVKGKTVPGGVPSAAPAQANPPGK